MFNPHFVALLMSTLLTWLIYGWVCLGYGGLFFRLCRVAEARVDDFVWVFWVGLGVLLALLQIWQLVLPVNGYAFVALIGIGLLVCLRAMPDLFGAASKIS